MAATKLSSLPVFGGSNPVAMSPAPAGAAPGANGYNPYPNGSPMNATSPFSPYYGMPTAPGFTQGYDPSSMSMTDYLKTVYDPSGFNAFKDQATRVGPSAWANLATQDQGAQAAKTKSADASQANAQTAQAEDDLASRGGLSSGARERATIEGSKNYLSMSQGVEQQKNLNDLQIGMNDQQNKIQELSQLPGMEQQQAGMWENAKNTDVSNAVSANDKANSYNQNLYNTQMQAWGANQQANATANAGKK